MARGARPLALLGLRLLPDAASVAAPDACNSGASQQLSCQLPVVTYYWLNITSTLQSCHKGHVRQASCARFVCGLAWPLRFLKLLHRGKGRFRCSRACGGCAQLHGGAFLPMTTCSWSLVNPGSSSSSSRARLQLPTFSMLHGAVQKHSCTPHADMLGGCARMAAVVQWRNFSDMASAPGVARFVWGNSSNICSSETTSCFGVACSARQQL